MSLDLNKMTDNEISDAKKYLEYIVRDYKSGSSFSDWCLYKKGVEIPSRKLIRFILKSLTYMQIDFTYKIGGCEYWRLTVVFK